MTTDELVSLQLVAARPLEVHAVRVVDEIVLLHEPTAELHLLNPTGALVWECLDGESTLDEIATDIADIGDLDLAQVQADVRRLVADMLAADLLSVVDEGDPAPS